MERALELGSKAPACEEMGSRGCRLRPWWRVGPAARPAGPHRARRDRRGGREGLASLEMVRRETGCGRSTRSHGLAQARARRAGDADRAGRLWGADETEESRGPAGHWDDERDGELASTVATLVGRVRAGPRVGERRCRSRKPPSTRSARTRPRSTLAPPPARRLEAVAAVVRAEVDDRPVAFRARGSVRHLHLHPADGSIA